MLHLIGGHLSEKLRDRRHHRPFICPFRLPILAHVLGLVGAPRHSINNIYFVRSLAFSWYGSRCYHTGRAMRPELSGHVTNAITRLHAAEVTRRRLHNSSADIVNQLATSLRSGSYGS